jgi:transcriptional regulator with XRE-family HTH domain
MKTLGDVLRAARTERGWTLRHVESETGVSNGYLSLIETGNVKSPAPRYLKTLADAYALDFTALMTLAGHPSGPTPTGGTTDAIMTSPADSEISGRSLASAAPTPAARANTGEIIDARDGTEDDANQDADAPDAQRSTPGGVTRAADLTAHGSAFRWRPAAALGAASPRGPRQDDERHGDAASAIARSSDRVLHGRAADPADAPADELNALERLVREDLDGLTLEEIGHVRAFVAGLRAARAVRAASSRASRD